MVGRPFLITTDLPKGGTCHLGRWREGRGEGKEGKCPPRDRLPLCGWRRRGLGC